MSSSVLSEQTVSHLLSVPPAPPSHCVPLLCLSKFLLSFHSLVFSFALFSVTKSRLTRRPRQQLALRVCLSLACFINHGSMTIISVLSTISNVWIVKVFMCNKGLFHVPEIEHHYDFPMGCFLYYLEWLYLIFCEHLDTICLTCWATDVCG